MKSHELSFILNDISDLISDDKATRIIKEITDELLLGFEPTEAINRVRKRLLMMWLIFNRYINEEEVKRREEELKYFVEDKDLIFRKTKEEIAAGLQLAVEYVEHYETAIQQKIPMYYTTYENALHEFETKYKDRMIDDYRRARYEDDWD